MAWRPDFYPWYRDFELYPSGVADGVGYWAEERILGGVVLFDRWDPGQSAEPELLSAGCVSSSAPSYKSDVVYYHSNTKDTTCCLYQLTGGQRQALLNVLLAKTPSTPSLLPIHGDNNNRVYVDPEDPMKETGIYRDKWERVP